MVLPWAVHPAPTSAACLRICCPAGRDVSPHRGLSTLVLHGPVHETHSLENIVCYVEKLTQPVTWAVQNLVCLHISL